MIFKRETDKNFGFLKIETSIKPESRLSKYFCFLRPFVRSFVVFSFIDLNVV